MKKFRKEDRTIWRLLTWLVARLMKGPDTLCECCDTWTFWNGHYDPGVGGYPNAPIICDWCDYKLGVMRLQDDIREQS